jgi:nitronate monooxygenase
MSAEFSAAAQDFCSRVGIRYPVIGGPMYPCSNPELTAAVSASGGIGILQPISLTYVHGHDYRAGIRLMRRLTDQPIGMNALIEKSSRKYRQLMSEWVDIAIEEGIRFFVTSLGKPDWVVERVHAAGGLVYHDVTDSKWARIGLDNGVDGLICVNDRAGGHAGQRTMEQLYDDLADLGVPLVCAGGIGGGTDFRRALDYGYAACQLGTRYIASLECRASQAYKRAVVESGEVDIVLSERVTGIPVSVINNGFIRRTGTRLGRFSRWMLAGRRTRHWMRTWFALKSIWQLKRASLDENGNQEYWQAGKSVAAIDAVESCAAIMQRLVSAGPEGR